MVRIWSFNNFHQIILKIWCPDFIITPSKPINPSHTFISSAVKYSHVSFERCHQTRTFNRRQSIFEAHFRSVGWHCFSFLQERRQWCGNDAEEWCWVSSWWAWRTRYGVQNDLQVHRSGWVWRRGLKNTLCRGIIHLSLVMWCQWWFTVEFQCLAEVDLGKWVCLSFELLFGTSLRRVSFRSKDVHKSFCFNNNDFTCVIDFTRYDS